MAPLLRLSLRQRRALKKVLLILLLVSYHNSLRSRVYLHRAAVLAPRRSPWRQLLKGDESSFLLMTGVSIMAFNSLLCIVFDLDNENDNDNITHRRRGRPPSLAPEDELGLFLFYISSMLGLKHLCVIFGVVPSVCSRAINKVMSLILKKLRRHPLAEVKFPDHEKKQQFASMIQRREPEISDVIGFMDGVSLRTECTSDELTQNAYYGGYEKDTVVNNVFAYGPDGKIFLCAINFPGSWHDGSLAANLLPFIREKIGEYKICVDQGFPRNGDAADVLVGPLCERQVRRLHPTVVEQLIKISNLHTSLRQASEWGMRGLQGSYPRFKKRLPTCSRRRRMLIESIIYVHNFRTEVVGMNQIATVFDPEYERSINLEGYDRIRTYYFRGDDYID